MPGGAAEEMDRQKQSSSIITFKISFFPKEHGKATKPPQKHIFHLHSDPTPQLCTCCSHLHSKDKLTSARSPKLQQPGGPPEKRGRVKNAPLIQPFQKQLGLPPGSASGWTPAPCSPRGLWDDQRSQEQCATTQSSEIQKSTTRGGGKAPKLKARPNSLLCRRARASSNAKPLWTAVSLSSGDMSLALATLDPSGHGPCTRGAPCPLPAPTAGENSSVFPSLEEGRCE